MNIDLDDIERRINDGIYGDDRMTDTGRDDAFAALAVLLAEVERLREMLLNAGGPREAEELAALALRHERAAVVAWLREVSERRFARNEREAGIVFRLAHEIERGEHHQKEKP
jgi:hypothetical protein